MRRNLKTSAVRVVLFLALAGFASAQSPSSERAFPQSKATIERTLKTLQEFTSGRLPTLGGFAAPGDHPLDQYQRGFFQCSVQVSSAPSGGSLVRVNAKITAWYQAASPAQSGYQVMTSNGRLESDLLDRLSEALGNAASAPAATKSPQSGATPAASSRAMPDAPSSASATQIFHSSSSPGSQAPSIATQRAVADRHLESLQADEKNLEEILHNQSHPSNLIAVKGDGTPIFGSPNEGAKVLFRASAQDEFEMLDMNANWIHVRISGLSRGWILRSSVEISDGVAPTAKAQMPEKPQPRPANAPRYQIEHEEIAAFPASWAPLQGKVVKIVSVQPATATGGDSRAKLDFAKSLFEKEYVELSKAQTSAAGVVVIFDSADGGMLATTLPVLQDWKAGRLSDEAMWRRCYVDPPEMVTSTFGQ